MDKSWDSVARRYVEHDTTEQETFGPLTDWPLSSAEGYVVRPVDLGAVPAANDNAGLRGAAAMGAKTVASTANVRIDATSRFILTDANVHTGILTYTEVPVAAQATLNDLRDLPGFIYLGSPYSTYLLGHDTAAYEVSYAAALLMRRGFRIFAPITHGHNISKHAALPVSWEFWKAQCQPMIDAASALIVLTMNGWQESVGLVYEISCFERTGRPIVYVEPAVLASENMRAA